MDQVIDGPEHEFGYTTSRTLRMKKKSAELIKSSMVILYQSISTCSTIQCDMQHKVNIWIQTYCNKQEQSITELQKNIQ